MNNKKKMVELMMRLHQLQTVAVVLLLLGIVVGSEGPSNADAHDFNIWPMPKSVSNGKGMLFLAQDFQLITNFTDASGILKDAFARINAVITMGHAVDANFSALHSSLLLEGLHVLIFSSNEQLQYGIDESYKLLVPSSHQPDYARLEARTVYGALHGLQTFSQLCHFNLATSRIEIRSIPWTIIDQPRFPYRGLLIDTSRHYQPLPMIKKVIDSMAYAKLSIPSYFGRYNMRASDSDVGQDEQSACLFYMNVLHWHVVDTQSFPLEIPSYPKLWSGAYSVSERYTFVDAAEVVSYAQRQGINVLAEIDVPGHALSWGKGYPSLWPTKDCQEPLDVSNEFTFKVIDGILSDFSRIFKFKFVHLGGDEVNTSCWTSTPRIMNWLESHGMNGSEAYRYFVLRAQKIALSHGYEIINWEETFNNFGNKLSQKTVVHNWLGGGVAEQVVAAGLRCIVSNQDKWYLDHLDTTWQEFYMNEPLTNITDTEKQKLVIGGEVCMWGETVDGSDIEQTIWPRAAAAAERLWTPYDKLAKDPKRVTRRLAHFRCLLNQRGVAAAPLAGPGRGAPEEPGSCFSQ